MHSNNGRKGSRYSWPPDQRPKHSPPPGMIWRQCQAELKDGTVCGWWYAENALKESFRCSKHLNYDQAPDLAPLTRKIKLPRY